MNILSFDIEEWFIEKTYKGGLQWKYEAYDNMLLRILDLLDEYSTKATFFCLGSLAQDFSYVIKQISERGHEIGSHSLRHEWINKMTPEEFRTDTIVGNDKIEQITGVKIKSYRAPAFSIGESNKWAFEILSELGIENDCSIFAGIREIGGFPQMDGLNNPCKLEIGGSQINEFPITLGKIPFINKKIAYSGGGYFRLLPLSFVKQQINKSDYVMCYFHMADLVDFRSKILSKADYETYFKESGTLKNRYFRYLKSNIGRKRSFQGLSKLLDSYKFISVEEASKENQKFPKITL